MSDDDLEKKMEFIVEQQANFSAQMGQLQDRMGQLEELVARFAQATAERFQLTDRRHAEHEGRLAEQEERMAALVDAHIQTEESLRNLIAVVDRYFSEGRNGQAEG